MDNPSIDEQVRAKQDICILTRLLINMAVVAKKEDTNRLLFGDITSEEMQLLKHVAEGILKLGKGSLERVLKDLKKAEEIKGRGVVADNVFYPNYPEFQRFSKNVLKEIDQLKSPEASLKQLISRTNEELLETIGKFYGFYNNYHDKGKTENFTLSALKEKVEKPVQEIETLIEIGDQVFVEKRKLEPVSLISPHSEYTAALVKNLIHLCYADDGQFSDIERILVKAFLTSAAGIDKPEVEEYISKLDLEVRMENELADRISRDYCKPISKMRDKIESRQQYEQEFQRLYSELKERFPEHDPKIIGRVLKGLATADVLMRRLRYLHGALTPEVRELLIELGKSCLYLREEKNIFRMVSQYNRVLICTEDNDSVFASLANKGGYGIHAARGIIDFHKQLSEKRPNVVVISKNYENYEYLQLEIEKYKEDERSYGPSVIVLDKVPPETSEVWGARLIRAVEEAHVRPGDYELSSRPVNTHRPSITPDPNLMEEISNGWGKKE